MTSTKLTCNWSKSYWHVTRELMNDNKRFAENKRTQDILKLLQEQLDKNKTRTMTFTEDGLELAIKLVKETYNV